VAELRITDITPQGGGRPRLRLRAGDRLVPVRPARSVWLDTTRKERPVMTGTSDRFGGRRFSNGPRVLAAGILAVPVVSASVLVVMATGVAVPVPLAAVAGIVVCATSVVGMLAGRSR
jgi:hypothetical protein